jgi:hypothetical protein
MKNKFDWLNHLFNFLAVILGVYLAFLINERAKIKQDRKESTVLMHSLITDLKEDIRVYENYQIPENNEQQKHIGKVLELLLANELEGIGNQLTEAIQVENFTPTTSTYSSMKSAGKLHLIEDLALQKALSDYYEGLVQESVRKGEFQVDFFTNELLTWLTTNIDLLDMGLLKQDELIVLRNKLIIYASLIEQKVGAYQMNVDDSKKLKQDIETIIAAK